VNATGHMILFQMAYNNMTPEVQKRVSALIHNPNNPEEGGYKTDKRDNDVPSAATYPDVYKHDVRQIPGADAKGYNHFYNLPIGDPKYTAGKKPSSPNGLDWLASQEKILADPKTSDDLKANALRWTAHMFGDVGAQPAHAVNYYSARFPNGDEGGNKFEVTYDPNSHFTGNLHGLLDAGGAHKTANGKVEENFKFISEPLDASSRAYVESRAQQIQQQYPRERYIAQVNDQNPQDWVKDLSAQAQQVWGEFTPGEHVAADDKRLAGIEQMMNQNLAISAYRLAELCNHAFGTAQSAAEAAAEVPPHAPVVQVG